MGPTTGRRSKARSPACRCGPFTSRRRRPETILVGTCPSALFRSDDGGADLGRGRGDHRNRLSAHPAHARHPHRHRSGQSGSGMGRRGDRRRPRQPRRRPHLGAGRQGAEFARHSRPGRRPPARRRAPAAGGDEQRPQRQRRRRRDVAAGRASAASCRGRTAAPWPSRAAGRRWCCSAPATGRRAATGWWRARRTPAARWAAAAMPAPGQQHRLGFAVHPADPDLIYAASVSGEVYRSTDGGGMGETGSRIWRNPRPGLVAVRNREREE